MIIPAAYKRSLSPSAHRITPSRPRWAFAGINIERQPAKQVRRCRKK